MKFSVGVRFTKSRFTTTFFVVLLLLIFINCKPVPIFRLNLGCCIRQLRLAVLEVDVYLYELLYKLSKVENFCLILSKRKTVNIVF